MPQAGGAQEFPPNILDQAQRHADSRGAEAIMPVDVFAQIAAHQRGDHRPTLIPI